MDDHDSQEGCSHFASSVTSHAYAQQQGQIRRTENSEAKEARLQKIAAAYRNLMEAIGEDVTRDGLKDTPTRAAKAMLFFTEGYTKCIEGEVIIGLCQVLILKRCCWKSHFPGGSSGDGDRSQY